MSPLVRRRRQRKVWHRSARFLRERPGVAVLLGGLGVVVVVGLWCVVSTWRCSAALAEVERSGLILRQQLVEADADGARQALEDYREAAETARSRTSGPTFWALERLPIVGDDAAALAAAARVLDDLGREALPPVVESADQVTARAFHPEDKQFPLERIAGLREPARQGRAAFERAAAELDEIDSAGLVGPLRTRFEELRTLVVTARDTLGSAYRAAELMPELLGQDGPRHYLLVFANNAELRSAGGLAGSISLVRAAGGQVEIVDQEASHNFGITERSPIPLTSEERNVFGDALGRYFLDATMTPDIPRAAELMAAHWRADYDQPIDGIFLVDPVAVSYLLGGTGPVDVPGYAPVTAGNVVESVENTIYRLTTDFAEHDEYQHAVAKAVFNAFADGRGEAASVISALATGVQEGRIRMHAFDRSVQQQVAGTAIAGEMPGDEEAVGVYLNDATESKMSYYLEYDVELVARSCDDGVQELAGSVDLTNDTPDDIADLPPTVTGHTAEDTDTLPGDQKVGMYLMFPGSGRLMELEVPGRRIVAPTTFPLGARSVAPVFLTLAPEETASVEFVVTTGRGQTGDTDLFVTPGATPGGGSRTVQSACASQ